MLKTSKLMTGKPYTRHSGSASKCDGDDSGMGRSCTQLGQERFKNEEKKQPRSSAPEKRSSRLVRGGGGGERSVSA